MTQHDSVDKIVAEMRGSATELRCKAGDSTHVLHVTARKNAETVNAWAARLESTHREECERLRELVAADREIDKCEAALDGHRDAETYTEAWAAAQLLLHRAHDAAKKRRAAALAALTPKEPAR